jgi:hypothetical protein
VRPLKEGSSDGGELTMVTTRVLDQRKSSFGPGVARAWRAVVESGGAGGVALRCLLISVAQPQQAVDYQSILNCVVERI